MRSLDHRRLADAQAFLGKVQLNEKKSALTTFAGHVAKNGLVMAFIMAAKAGDKEVDVANQLTKWLVAKNSPVSGQVSALLNGKPALPDNDDRFKDFARILIGCRDNSVLMAIQREASAWVSKAKLLSQALAPEDSGGGG